MNSQLFQITFWEIGRSALCGAGICFVYLFLLWKTTLLYTKYKKGLILFFSFILRLLLLLFLLKLSAFEKVSNLFCVLVFFCLTRLIVLKRIQKKGVVHG